MLAAGDTQHPLCVASGDLRRTVESAVHDFDCRCACLLGLLFQLIRDVTHVEARVHSNAGIERSDGVHGRARRDQSKGLTQRFEAEIGSVNAYNHTIEHCHDPRITEPDPRHIRADAEPTEYLSPTPRTNSCRHADALARGDIPERWADGGAGVEQDVVAAQRHRSANGSTVTLFERVLQVAVHARTVTRTVLPTRNACPEGANRVS